MSAHVHDQKLSVGGLNSAHQGSVVYTQAPHVCNLRESTHIHIHKHTHTPVNHSLATSTAIILCHAYIDDRIITFVTLCHGTVDRIAFSLLEVVMFLQRFAGTRLASCGLKDSGFN